MLGVGGWQGKHRHMGHLDTHLYLCMCVWVQVGVGVMGEGRRRNLLLGKGPEYRGPAACGPGEVSARGVCVGGCLVPPW